MLNPFPWNYRFVLYILYNAHIDIYEIGQRTKITNAIDSSCLVYVASKLWASVGTVWYISRSNYIPLWHIYLLHLHHHTAVTPNHHCPALMWQSNLDASIQKAPYHPAIARVVGNQGIVRVLHGVDATHQYSHPHQYDTPAIENEQA